MDLVDVETNGLRRALLTENARAEVSGGSLEAAEWTAVHSRSGGQVTLVGTEIRSQGTSAAEAHADSELWVEGSWLSVAQPLISPCRIGHATSRRVRV